MHATVTCRHRSPSISARRAFTLIELLVVIAVIAVLIALLLPALRGAREAGRSSVCLSNQRSILSVLALYSDDAKRYIPRECGSGHWVIPGAPLNSTPPLSDSEKMDISWPFNLRPYLDQRATTIDKTGGLGDDQYRRAPYYHDPSRPRDAHNVHFVNNGFRFTKPGVLSQATKPPTPIDMVQHPAQTFYLTCFVDDTDAYRSRFWFGEASSTLFVGQFYDMWCDTNLRGKDAGPVTIPTRAQRTAPRRHGNSANAACFDGHASTVSAAAVTTLANWDDHDYRR